MPSTNPTAERLVHALVAGRADEALASMADDAVFRSPVAEYAGREVFTPVLRAVGQVVQGGTVTSVGAVGDDTVAFFTAEVEGQAVDGALRVAAAPDGPAVAVTLMLRPLAALLAGLERMKALLAA